jgi:hypothetical protein
MINWVNDLIQNESKMDLIATIMIVLMPFVFFVFWGGFLQEIDFKGLDYRTVGVFTLLYGYAVLTSRIKFRRTGKLLAIKKNDTLKTILDGIKEVKFKRTDKRLGFAFVKQLNKDKREEANKILTDKKIKRLNNKSTKLLSKGKDNSDLEKQMEFLENNPLIDTKFTPFEFGKLINKNVMFVQKIKREDGKSVEHNVEYAGIKRASFVEFARGLVFGGAIIGFAWGLPFDVTIAYLSLLILGITSTSILQTILAIYDTNGNFKEAMEKKLNYMIECREYVNTTVADEVIFTPTFKELSKDNTEPNKNVLEGS